MMKTMQLLSLGCDKNTVDSQNMLSLMMAGGYTLVEEGEAADVFILNTCCFIHDAKQESINAILEIIDKKKAGLARAVIVTGCLAERYKKEIREEFPEVDAILGTNAYADILKAADEALAEKSDPVPETRPHVLMTPGHYAYLRIAEGCDKRCTYCVIPDVRGRYVSRPMDEILKEASACAEMGVKELLIVAQETTLYGTDIYGEKRLPALLEALSGIDGIEWIRLLYCYPEEITDELIEVMRSTPKVCHYIDMPIQHSNDRILKRMGRRTTGGAIRSIVKRLRDAMPDIAIRTTLITGFPGETEEEHEELLAFVEEMRFDRLGVFTYSPEEGTPAFSFPDQVDEEVKQRRYAELMELQQEISCEISASFVGRTVSAIVDGRIPEDDVYAGRTWRDMPELDGYLFFTSPYELMSGAMVDVTVTAASEYDLIGEMRDEQ